MASPRSVLTVQQAVSWLLNENQMFMCRPDGSNTHDHYWDATTGKTVAAPKRQTFTPEKLCPAHSRAREELPKPYRNRSQPRTGQIFRAEA